MLTRLRPVVLACVMVLAAAVSQAQDTVANFLYLVPIETVTNAGGGSYRGPKYFKWRFGTGTITAPWSMMDYGFMPTGLVHAVNLTPEDEAFLAQQGDVYRWPDILDNPVTDPALPVFFETLRIPTDWLTPSSTYRELLRSMAGLFQFAQRYTGLSGHALFDGGVTLDTNYRSMPPDAKAWLDQTMASLGYPPIAGNPKLRQVVKQAGDLWGGQPFILGSFTF